MVELESGAHPIEVHGESRSSYGVSGRADRRARMPSTMGPKRETERGDDLAVHDRRTIKVYSQSLREVLTKINENLQDDAPTKAIRLIHDRVGGTVDTLRILADHARHDFATDAMSMLRMLFDVMWQAEYLMHDPSQRHERASLFLDWKWVERYQSIERVDTCGLAIARHLRTSPKRRDAEPEIRSRYEAVKHRYLTPQKRNRFHWYEPRNLGKLTTEIGRQDEYRWFQPLLSGAVHSAVWTLDDGPMVTEATTISMAIDATFRILGLITDHLDLSLSDATSHFVEMAQQDILGENPFARNH